MPRRVNQKLYPGLTYQERRNQADRWRKRYRGKEYTYPRKPGESLPDSYKRAMKEWLRDKARIDDVEEEANAEERARAYWLNRVAEMEAVIESIEGDPEAAMKPKEWLEWMKVNALKDEFESRADAGELPTAKRTDGEVFPLAGAAPWKRKGVRPEVEESKTVGAAVDSFLRGKKTEADAGQIKHNRYEQIRIHLSRFVTAKPEKGKDVKPGFLDRSEPVDSIGNGTLMNYRTNLIESIANGELKPKTANDRISVALQFVKHCVVHGAIPRPAVLDSPRSLTVTVPAKKIEYLSDEELTTVFENASERMKLYVLLALNCGMTQSDIGQLRRDEVDLKRGRIVRKRSKTRDAHGDSVPEVDYKLWPETVRLLKRYRSKDKTSELALLSESGKPIWEDGSTYKPIDSEWKGKLKRTVGDDWPGKSFGKVKKTASTKLETDDAFSRFGDLWQGHSAGSVRKRHYAAEDSRGFDKAVTWLGAQWPELSGVE